MARHHYQPTARAEERIRQLEEELYVARHDIVELMPLEAKDLLTSYYSCSSSQEFGAWKLDVINRLVSMAERDPEASGVVQDRGYCPLCKGGSTGLYDLGFALPNGLFGHLLGHGYGNRHQCPVTHAAFQNAYHSLRDTLAASQRRKQKV
jgi:hypothetical protein